MSKFKALVIMAIVFSITSVVALSQDDGNNNGRRRGQMRDKMKQRAKEWFMELPGVEDEMKKHKENMKEIMDTMRQKAEELRKKYMEENKDKEGGEGMEAIHDKIAEEMKDTVTSVAEKMVDERIRHTRAIADLMEKYKTDAIEKLKEQMEKRHAERKGRRGGRGKGRRGNNGDDNNDVDVEGAVF